MWTPSTYIYIQFAVIKGLTQHVNLCGGDWSVGPGDRHQRTDTPEYGMSTVIARGDLWRMTAPTIIGA